MTENNLQKFAELGFEDFRKMAKDQSLSANEKIGFPDSYRGGKEKIIFDDIQNKMSPLLEEGAVVLDIGPGCGPLADQIINHCHEHLQKLVLVDSQEMLDHIKNEDFIEKVPAFYPECPELFHKYTGRVDALICYSVLHYVFVEANFWGFLDKSMSLLAPGGCFLLGDIPNVSKRKRFFSSQTGIAFHQEYTNSKELPEVKHVCIEPDTIDDSVMIGILMRARLAGFDAYILPQGDDLPMANRREDILIIRP